MRRHNERFENLPEDIRVNKAGKDAGLMRKISRGQYFVTADDMDLNGLFYGGSCLEFSSPRDDERSTPKGWIRGDTLNWPSVGSQGCVSHVSTWS